MDDQQSNSIDFSLNEKSTEKTFERTKKIKNIVNYFREYCNCTTIHGFKYFGEKRTVFEKIWWFIVFVCCLIICALSIVTVYRKWDSSPVIVSFATKGEPIYNIPFPAVTVCLESKINQSVFNYTAAVTKKTSGEVLNDTEETILGHLSFICYYRNGLNYSASSTFSASELLEVLEKVSPKFSIINCKYLGLPTRCESLFTSIITDDGLCYTSNMLDRNELYTKNVVHYSNYHKIDERGGNWSVEYGYSDSADIHVYPRRALLSGARYALTFDLKTPNEKVDTMCRDSMQGYKVLFHMPTRIPLLSQQYIRVPLNRVFAAAIRPSRIMTSDAVKGYAPVKRNCYFPSERKLKYFRTYTSRNCNLECLTNITLNDCHCAAFFMPRENGTEICSGLDYPCVTKAEYRLQLLNLYKKIALKKHTKPLYDTQLSCDCMPVCTDIDYAIGISQTNWSPEVHAANDTNDNLTNYHFTRVSAYFIHGSFIGSERNELYGPIDFLANFGGLLGLCTGFSILSIMEIIYFLTVRLICNVRLYNHWTGPTN